MVRILSIDPGMRNLAWCYMDGETGEVLSLGREDIYRTEKIEIAPCYSNIQRWCRDHHDMLVDASVVLIEKQFCDRKVILSTCLNTIQTVLMCFTHGKHLLVHAMSVKKFFSTVKTTHRNNKAASVAKASELYPTIAVTTGKLDDVADAYLLCRYALMSGLLSTLFSGGKPEDGGPCGGQ
jgi:Holliday junction resolvasome RuvABC endonuclease subunit